MIKILFFIDDLSGGGAEKVLQTLVNNMDPCAFHITVQTVNYEAPSQYLAEHVRYKAINRFRSPWLKKLYSYWIRLCAEYGWLYPLYIRDDYDVEVAYLENGATKMIAGSTNQKALKLAWVHCDMCAIPMDEKRRKKMLRHYRTYDRVVCVAETVRDSFMRQFPEAPESLVLHNVNDDAEIRKKSLAFVPQRDEKPLMIAVGRLKPEKGNDRLVEACCMLKNDGLEFRLWILGEGPERTKLEQLIQQYQLEKEVTLLGFQKNPYPYMDLADVIVCPSRTEGFSTVVTEALILGKPVVTTPCSGMHELLGDSEFGLITEASVEGIYRGLKTMLENPERAAVYASAAKVRGKDFSKETILRRTEEFFREELRKKREPMA